MARPTTRESAYADLVAGLLDARDDAATTRFDEELDSAVADGRLDATTARTLRWWQRAAVRGVVEHASAALPAVMVALERAQDAVDDDLAGRSESLDLALAGSPEPTPAPEPPASPVAESTASPVAESTPAATTQTDFTPEPAAAPARHWQAPPPVSRLPRPPVSAPDPDVDTEPAPGRRLLVAGLTPLPPPP